MSQLLLPHRYLSRGDIPVFEEDPVVPPIEGVSPFTLEGDDTFNTSSPTLKDGTLLTAQAKVIFDGGLWMLEDFNNRQYSLEGGTIYGQAASDNLYYYARTTGSLFNALALGLRLTGYLGFLDEMATIADIMYGVLAVGYRDEDPASVWGPAHNYLMWVWGLSHPEYHGTDYHPLDNIRSHTVILQLARALDLNRGKTSPAGKDYDALADKWQAYLRDHWMNVWQGPEKVGSGPSGWSNNYEGNWHDIYQVPPGSGHYRAPLGYYPIQSRHHTHTHVGASTAHYYLGLALPEHADATNIGLHGITEYYLNRNYYQYVGAYGTQGVWTRSINFTGHGSTADPTGNYPQPMTYAGYIVMNMVDLWLEGVLPNFPTNWGVPVTRTINDFAISNLLSGEGAQSDLLDNNTLTNLTNANGQTMDIRSAADFGFSNPLNNGQFLGRDYAFLLPWDTPDNKLENHILQRMGTSSAFNGGDITAFPKLMHVVVGRIMKEMGASDWQLGAA